ncbi:hypothetical protein PTKIN_Ptkin06aG0180400 [Pterospermum kingtungense]
MLMIQGISMFSNNIPFVEASRGLAYFEKVTVPPPPPSSAILPGSSVLSPPPSPKANVPPQDGTAISP